MGSRAEVRFMYGTSVEAAVYVHWDGYPEGIASLFDRFYAAVEAETNDHRYGDPSYLAAKFVVFVAREGSSSGPQGNLNFLGVGIVQPGKSDFTYAYEVQTISGGVNRPPVTLIER